jgi:tRNA-specific 2-thiouridylase
MDGEMMMDGRVVGKHRGFPFYTIGQRRGLGVAVGAPLYVTGIDHRRNRIELGSEERLYRTSLVAGHVNLIKYASLEAPVEVRARVRYRDEGGEATARSLNDGRLAVVFKEPRRAITPGQSVVLYEGEDLVGGGIIDEVTG